MYSLADCIALLDCSQQNASKQLAVMQAQHTHTCSQKTQSTEGAARSPERRECQRGKNARTENQIKNTFFSLVRLFYSLHFCSGTICINVYFKQRTISSVLFTVAICTLSRVQSHVYLAPDPMSTKHKTSNRAAKINLLANATRDAN